MPEHLQPSRLRLSIVVPVYNGAATLRKCLQSVRASGFESWQLIVVDDGSTDDSADIAAELGAQVLTTQGREGPAAARNLGASRAEGEVLLFLDADCSVHPETLQAVADRFRNEPEISALFGSYDAEPSAPGLVARYKNLQHHHVHQCGDEEARTFWAGCGAIRRAAFEQLGGFDVERYSRPSIEDIELGYRLTDSGGRIRLAKEVQVKHHKAWTLLGTLRSDLLDRGLPWIELLSAREDVASDLNLGWRGRLGVVLSVLLAISMCASVIWHRVAIVAVASAIAVLILHRDFYRLLLRDGGLRLLAVGVFMHWLYHLNCALAWLVGNARSRLRRRRRRPSVA